MPVQANWTRCWPAASIVGSVSVSCCLVVSIVKGTAAPSTIAREILRSAALSTTVRVGLATAMLIVSSPEKVIALASGRIVMS